MLQIRQRFQTPQIDWAEGSASSVTGNPPPWAPRFRGDVFLALRRLAPRRLVFRRLTIVIGLLLLAQTSIGQAATKGEARTALIIGNSGYASSPLVNPVNDARDLAKVLEGLGFEVDLRLDQSQRQMKVAIRSFREKLKRRDGVGLFYYAGHGMEVGGQNYLIPVGADITSEGYVDLEGVSMREVTTGLADARNRMNIVILDACRNHPFARSFRSSSRALAVMRAPAETLIAYATEPGNVAADGSVGARNSPYAKALIETIQKPGLRLVDVFRQTRARVKDATGGGQVPWQSDNLTTEAFYFVPAGSVVGSASGAGQSLAIVRPIRPGSSGGFSLGDLDKAAGEEELARGEWEKRSLERTSSFVQTKSFEKRRVSDALKLAAWERFLSAYGAEDPYSRTDNEERRYARGRIEGFRPKFASLVVRSNVSGGILMIDGQAVGSTSAAAHQLNPGPHSIRIEKQGYKAFEQTLTLAAGDRETLKAVLDRLSLAASGMVVVPAGNFYSGCNEKVDSECDDDEKPGKTRYLDAFQIDATEVTVTAFRECVDRGPCSSTGLTMPYYSEQEQFEWAFACNWGKSGRAHHPINCVDWNQAKKYCEWRGHRLPNEWEWEKAARGTDGRKYPWGNKGYGAVQSVANIADETAKRSQVGWKVAEGYDDGAYTTAAVGKYPRGASPYGASDMIGNVWEWTSSSSSSRRVVRGGSWRSNPRNARASNRVRGDPGDRDSSIGFRCAQ